MFIGTLAIVASFFLLKYRVNVVATTGKFGWCEKYLGDGGTYRFMVICSILLFFWGVANLTGTEDILMSPLSNFLKMGGSGGGGNAGGSGDEMGF